MAFLSSQAFAQAMAICRGVAIGYLRDFRG